MPSSHQGPNSKSHLKTLAHGALTNFLLGSLGLEEEDNLDCHKTAESGADAVAGALYTSETVRDSAHIVTMSITGTDRVQTNRVRRDGRRRAPCRPIDVEVTMKDAFGEVSQVMVRSVSLSFARLTHGEWKSVWPRVCRDLGIGLKQGLDRSSLAESVADWSDVTRVVTSTLARELTFKRKDFLDYVRVNNLLQTQDAELTFGPDLKSSRMITDDPGAGYAEWEIHVQLCEERESFEEVVGEFTTTVWSPTLKGTYADGTSLAQMGAKPKLPFEKMWKD